MLQCSVVRSLMHLFNRRHLLLSCISLGMVNTRPELQVVASKTLMAVQKERLGVDIKTMTDKAITDLFKFGALTDASETDHGSPQNVSLDFNVSVNNCWLVLFYNFSQHERCRLTCRRKFRRKPVRGSQKRKR